MSSSGLDQQQSVLPRPSLAGSSTPTLPIISKSSPPPTPSKNKAAADKFNYGECVAKRLKLLQDEGAMVIDEDQQENEAINKFGKIEFGEDYEWDIDAEATEETLAEYYEKQAVEKRKISKSAKMLNYFLDNNVYSYNALLALPRQEWVTWASMPNFNNLAANFYTIVSSNFLNFNLCNELQKAMGKPIPTTWHKINNLLKYQNFSEKQIKFFAYIVLSICDKKNKKKNTLMLSGIPSSGKSALLESLVRSFFAPSWGQPDNSARATFKWDNCVNKRIILWEEPVINLDNVEDCKKIMGGQAHVVQAKYKTCMEVLPTPVLVTANKFLINLVSNCNYPALDERIVEFKFLKRIEEKEFDFDFPITRNDWIEFYSVHRDMLTLVCKNKKFTFE